MARLGPHQRVESGLQPIHAMHEQREVHARRPPERVERRAGVRQQPPQQRREPVDVDRRGAVHRLGAAALQQQRGGRHHRAAWRTAGESPCGRRPATAAGVVALRGWRRPTASITSHGTRSALSRARRARSTCPRLGGARPAPRQPRRAAAAPDCGARRARAGATSIRHAGSSASAPSKSASRSTPTSEASGADVQPGTIAQVPAHQRRRHPHGRHGVPDVVLAVAERALAVLPGLAPVNRRQRREEAALRQPVQPPPARLPRRARIVLRARARPARSDTRRAAAPATPGPTDDVALGGMQIAARRIDAKRPARRARLLPGRQAEAVAEEHGHGRQPGVEARPRMSRDEQVVVGHVPPRGAALADADAARRAQRLDEVDAPAPSNDRKGSGCVAQSR